MYLEKIIDLSITGASEAGNVENKTKGTLEEIDGNIVIKYYEQFEGDSIRTENILTVSGNIVTLEKKGGVNVIMRFESGKSHDAIYNTQAGPVSLLIKTISVYSKTHEKGVDLELIYKICFSPQDETENKLNLKAVYN